MEYKIDAKEKWMEIYRNPISSKRLASQSLSEYIVQSELKENLDVFINTARSRNEALDYVLF